MRVLAAALALLLGAGAAGLARAVPPGLSLQFDGGEQGKVIFWGKVHSGTGMYCADCHLEIFDVSRSAQITRPDHTRDIYCFTCHNGETAFAPRRNCHQCHVEEEELAAD